MEGPQAALESLKKALELPSEAPGARRLGTPSKSRRARGMAVIVLDEMDQLLSQDHSVLYDLFRLPQASPSVRKPILPPLGASTSLQYECGTTAIILPFSMALLFECWLSHHVRYAEP